MEETGGIGVDVVIDNGGIYILIPLYPYHLLSFPVMVGSLFFLFLKLVKVHNIFADNVFVLSINYFLL